MQKKYIKTMPTTRGQHAASKADQARMDQAREGKEPTENLDQEIDSDEEERLDETFSFEGKEYNSYILMVDAKRKRNQDILEKSGLLDMSSLLKYQKKTASQRGIARKRKAEKKESLPSRKSNRLSGVQADGRYVENESGGNLTISGTTTSTTQQTIVPEKPAFYNHRINDGSDLTVQQAVELCEPKWIDDSSTATSANFFSKLSAVGMKMAARSPTSIIPSSESLASKIRLLSVNGDHNVSKVTPDRIYSVAAHPSPDQIVVCAGDKQGYVGFWNVDDTSEGDGVHLFRFHSRPVSCLSWTPSGRSMLSASYDGSVRWLDVEAQKFKQIFATYDDSVIYRDLLGRGLDEGYKYWTQYVCPDHRNANDQCFFLSTSVGTAVHVDLRVGKGQLTFHEKLSEKKINTLRYVIAVFNVMRIESP
jgi:WD40 repeat protein